MMGKDQGWLSSAPIDMEYDINRIIEITETNTYPYKRNIIYQ